MNKGTDEIILWELYEKQKEALKVVERNKFTLLAGQGRASKTVFSVWYLFYRAWKYPNTTHMMFRKTLSSGVDGLWSQTVKEVIENFFPLLKQVDGFKMNESTHTIVFPNGSRILLRGLDTAERADKVLSQGFHTVLLDEAQTIDFVYFSLLLTRIPNFKDSGIDVKIICTANWTSKTHWTKIFFGDKLSPDTRTPYNDTSEMLKFFTVDNTRLDAEGYLDTLNSIGDRRARLMCGGSDWFDEIEGALWEQYDIMRLDGDISDFRDIVIAFDPATTNNKNSDEHGVCIAGKKDGKYYVLNCFERKADINDIAKEVADLYETYECSKFIYEGNQGGNWIPALIEKYNKRIYFEKVTAKKGKLLRAEPIAALYKNRLVYHCKRFTELEDQMVTYTGNGDSPNALDSLVYALKYLSEGCTYFDINNLW